jgi:hypothetical protein
MKIDSIVSYVATDIIIEEFRISSVICTITHLEKELNSDVRICSQGVCLLMRGRTLKYPNAGILSNSRLLRSSRFASLPRDSTHGPRKEEREEIS